MSSTVNASAGRIVVGVDGSIWSYSALHWAVAEAAASGRHIEIVTVGREVGLPDVLRPADPSFSIGSSTVRRGKPAEKLLTTVGDGDLLVLGNSGRGRIQDAFLGAVASECVRRAPCPVAVVTPTAALRFEPKVRNRVVPHSPFTAAPKVPVLT